MALTLAKVNESPVRLGTGVMKVYTLAFDASYPTGGEAITLADIGYKGLYVAIVLPRLGYVFDYDYTNNKVLAYYSDYDAGADGALIEVPDTTNLSTVTGVRAIFFGV